MKSAVGFAFALEGRTDEMCSYKDNTVQATGNSETPHPYLCSQLVTCCERRVD